MARCAMCRAVQVAASSWGIASAIGCCGDDGSRIEAGAACSVGKQRELRLAGRHLVERRGRRVSLFLGALAGRYGEVAVVTQLEPIFEMALVVQSKVAGWTIVTVTSEGQLSHNIRIYDHPTSVIDAPLPSTCPCCCLRAPPKHGWARVSARCAFAISAKRRGWFRESGTCVAVLDGRLVEHSKTEDLWSTHCRTRVRHCCATLPFEST